MGQHEATSPASIPFVPPTPTSIKETGLSLGFMTDLALKIIYSEGNLSGYELAERMKLPYPGVVDHVLEFLKREKLCEVKGTGGFAEVGIGGRTARVLRLCGFPGLLRYHPVFPPAGVYNE